MEIVQLIKKLNNTELGKAGTNDTYVLIPQNLDVSDIFPEVNKSLMFVYKKNEEPVNIRYTFGREKRIVGLGPFYRKYNLCAGDELLLEKQTVNSEDRYFINFRKHTNTVVYQKMRQGFESLTPERKELLNEEIQIKYGEQKGNLEVNFIGNIKKRQDSPEATEVYDIKVGGNSIYNEFQGKEIIEIEVLDKEAVLRRFCAWKKYKFHTEVENE